TAGGDLLADLLEPARDRAFGDGLTELRHRDIHERSFLLSSSSRGGYGRSALAPTRRTAQRASDAHGSATRCRPPWLPSSRRDTPPRSTRWPTARRCA